MTGEELLITLRTWFQKFRTTPWFRITYLVLLGAIVAELYILTLSPLACVVVLLMPVTVFVVPYWFGERKLRRFAGNLLVVFVIAIVLAGAMSTQALLAQREPVPLQSFSDLSNNPMILTNGTVQPYRAPPDTPFTFRVKLTTTANGTPGQYRVFMNLTVVVTPTSFDRRAFMMTYSPGNGSSNNTRAGTWYETNLTLGDSIYGYAFSSWDNQTNWTTAGPDLGPLTASGWSFYGFFLVVTALSQVTTLAVVTYFAILFLWWYSVRAREARARALSRAAGVPKEGAKEDPKEVPKGPEPALTFGGKATKASAFTCTNCGADVEETDPKCPKCGAVFED